MNTSDLLKGYDLNKLTIGTLGGHSALDVCAGAKKYGFGTVVVAQEGREKTYTNYFRTRKGASSPGRLCHPERSRAERGGDEGSTRRPSAQHDTIGCVDDVIVLKNFKDVVKKEIQEELRKRNTIFIASRYFWVYFPNFSAIENDFRVPIFGNRTYIKVEERDQKPSQYDVLTKAGIRTPKIFARWQDIDRPVFVKAQEVQRGYERAFFFVPTAGQYETIGAQLEKEGKIAANWRSALIEEFILGAYVNFNFFYSPLNKELELMGTDTRRQTNLDGFLHLASHEQRFVRESFAVKRIETGHIAVTVKESLLEKAFDLGERFVAATKELLGKEIIGSFALQGAVVAEEGHEDIIIFDVSLRIPGSPGTRFTPYSGYLYGESVSFGERIAMEIQEALKQGRLEEIIT